jgi:hypothetical protein
MTEHSQETNQVNFAANNRQDSRKTAKEIAAAQQQSSLINSVQVTLFSAYLRDVYKLVWRIAQSQALQGLIIIVPIYDETGNVIGNNDAMISKEYEILPAGDVDVIQRQEKLDRMMSFWPVMQTTPLAEAFLMDILASAFPDSFDRYKKLMEQAKQEQVKRLKQLLFQTSTVLQGAISEDELKAMTPQEKQFLQQLSQQIQTELQNGNTGQASGNAPSPIPQLAGAGGDQRIGNSANSDAIK